MYLRHRRCPIALLVLPVNAHGRIPGRMRARDPPAPVRILMQQQPDGAAKGAGGRDGRSAAWVGPVFLHGSFRADVPSGIPCPANKNFTAIRQARKPFVTLNASTFLPRLNDILRISGTFGQE